MLHLKPLHASALRLPPTPDEQFLKCSLSVTIRGKWLVPEQPGG